MKDLKEKVYCRNCRFLKIRHISSTYTKYNCNHENNIKYKDSWHGNEKGWIQHVSVINSNNKCGWYKETGIFKKIWNRI